MPEEQAAPLASLRLGAVAVVIRQQHFLVIRRSTYVTAPGAYCFPGGGIEPGESEQQALRREIREELGVSIRPVKRLWESVTPWRVALCWWQAELEFPIPLTPDPSEVESVYWLTVDQMRRLPQLLESNHHFLDALARGEFRLARGSGSGD